jgi:predicted Rossmann fold nucleotide-binding protein DprA/Smf involved in DNA uptake
MLREKGDRHLAVTIFVRFRAYWLGASPLFWTDPYRIIGRGHNRRISTMPLLRAITIISGGQTGADRAAIDFALTHGLAHGGWCPRDRLAEDGRLDSRYRLRQTPSRRYAQRTEWNVRDSDATVVFTIAGPPQGGTALTIELADRLGKPWFHVARDADPPSTAPSLSPADHAARLIQFLRQHNVRRMNVAGPRASQEPDVAEFVRQVLEAALDA